VEIGEIQQNLNNTETNVQHNSATTHTHKGQRLHTAVGAHRVGDGASADYAELIVFL
jgi:hypothetical protein